MNAHDDKQARERLKSAAPGKVANAQAAPDELQAAPAPASQDDSALQTKAVYGGVPGIMMKQEGEAPASAASAAPEEAESEAAPQEQEEEAASAEAEEESNQEADAQETEAAEAQAQEAPAAETDSAPVQHTKLPIQAKLSLATGLKNIKKTVTSSKVWKDTKYGARRLFNLKTTDGEVRAWNKRVKANEQKRLLKEAKKKGITDPKKLEEASKSSGASLTEVMADPRMWAHFKEYAKQEWSIENHLAIEDLKKLQASPSLELAQQIQLNYFYGKSSIYEVNINTAAVERLRLAIEAKGVNVDWGAVVDPLIRGVMTNLADTFMRYKLVALSAKE